MKTTIATEKRLNVRMSPSDYAKLKLAAARAGMTVSAYVRNLVQRECKSLQTGAR